MDYRLALLLHTFKGLKLSPLERHALLKMHPFDCVDPVKVVERLAGEARLYIEHHKDWWRESADVIAQSKDRGVRWTYPNLSDWPRGWDNLKDADAVPELAHYMGEPVWTERPMIGIVGSRTPLPDTCLWMQKELPLFLKQTGAAVVSGGARGVDQWAHRLALAAGVPTVAVLPSGVLNPYPPAREDLWESILLQDGCILSAMPAHEPMRKQAFEARNHLIVGMCDCIFVVEANRRSGSHMTARITMDEDRDLCTLPVSVNAIQGHANLDLIADGRATLIRDATDLAVFFDRHRGKYSGPRAPQSVQRDSQKDSVDGPQTDAS